jgi:glycosyltransferase involved in cell wall biosynthesis
MNAPVVSVVMPVYNGEKYIKEAIESILRQTFVDFEFIIVDDASTDSTAEIIGSYSDPRIRYIKNETNLQVAKTLNKGIAAAKGTYIARMDADDISLPERFEQQVTFMQAHPDIDVCGTWYKTFGAQNYLQKLPAEHEQVKSDLLFYSPIAHPSVMMKTSIFLHDKYPEDFPKAEDYALWTQLIKRCRFANLPVCLLHYRVHTEQTGMAANDIQLASTRKALSSFVNNIGMKDIGDIHLSIWRREASSLHEVESYLLDLQEANEENKFFHPDALRSTLFNQWWNMCNLKIGMKTYRYFYGSKLYLPGRFKWRTHIKFLMRTLLSVII